MNLEKDPGMLTHRMLAYFLYPIDIRKIHEEDLDTILIFAKHNAKESIPDGFHAVFVFDENHLIAVKKGQ